MCTSAILTETKVFSSIFRQTFDKLRADRAVVFFSLFGIVLWSSVAFAVSPEINAVMVQCRNLASDRAAYQECLAVIERESELLLAGIEGDWLELAAERESQTAANIQSSSALLSDVEQLQRMVSQYREYRNEICAFSANELDSLSALPAVQACRISMNRQHATLLRRLYVERRARQTHGSFYRGYLLMTEDKGLFQSCELRQDWTIDADEELRQRILERYREVTSDALELVYVELRGQVLSAEDTESSIRMSHLNLMRPILDADCSAALSSTATDIGVSTQADELTDNSAEESDNAISEAAGESTLQAQDATIDDFGAAGFTYGYFGNWTSACAADARQVCQAQVQHSLSTEGDWQLLIDRSSNLYWRVRLIPKTDSHFVGGGFQLLLDGVARTTIPVASQQLLLEQAFTLMRGNEALKLINEMKFGATLELRWSGNVQGNSSLIFPLSGMQTALSYFDSQ